MKIVIAETFCYALLAISITTVCAQSEDPTDELIEAHAEKRLIKRDASLIFDHFPEPTSYRLKPKVIYRKVSKHSRIPKPKSLPHHKSRPVKKRYPVKKSKSKTRYGSSKKKTHSYMYKNRFLYKASNKIPTKHAYKLELPTGFGEPPAKFVGYHAPRPTAGIEPTVDSYGAPVKLPPIPLSPHSYPIPYERPMDFDQEYQSWQSFDKDQNVDNTYAYTNYNPSYVEDDYDTEIQQPDPTELSFNLESYSDVYKFNPEQGPIKFSNKKKPLYQTFVSKINRPWNGKREVDDQKIVGGPYAEPPGRFQNYETSGPSTPYKAYTRLNEDNFPQSHRLQDSDLASATASPYVNYKNSNMAFSPQNLNDVFSIVNK